MVRRFQVLRPVRESNPLLPGVVSQAFSMKADCDGSGAGCPGHFVVRSGWPRQEFGRSVITALPLSYLAGARAGVEPATGVIFRDIRGGEMNGSGTLPARSGAGCPSHLEEVPARRRGFVKRVDSVTNDVVSRAFAGPAGCFRRSRMLQPLYFYFMRISVFG